ncbi:MAG: adenylyltransferase/cytidyltransferase family protein [Candidatus Hydrogenedentes bacterium]|nr:adenylyltransferase/cytidyltransferase family protein [Candidatus Hydrogenedentota bacterium]
MQPQLSSPREVSRRRRLRNSWRSSRKTLGKIVKDHTELKKIVRKLQEEGRIVVLTNGCFDLIHVGHVRYLRAAKTEGNVLIAALNDDESVRKFKGLSGPLTPEDERAEVVAAFEGVDYVTLFSEPSADAILDLLRPDVHAKGTDYTPETVPERDTVLGYGGRIAIVGDPKMHSSSELLTRAAKKLKTDNEHA